MVQEYSMLHDIRSEVEKQIIGNPDMAKVLDERYLAYAYTVNPNTVYSDIFPSNINIIFYPNKGYNALGSIDVTFEFGANRKLLTDLENVIQTLSLHAMNATEMEEAAKDDSGYIK